jgi:hypothetical protein
MTRLIRDVFIVLGCSILALTLYVLFFGTTNLNGNTITGVTGTWKGALFYASDAVETGISKYYYYYCFLPSYLGEYETDKVLKVVENDSNIISSYTVSSNDLSSNDNYGTYGSYTTGWK